MKTSTTTQPRNGNKFARQATPAMITTLRGMATRASKSGAISAGHAKNIFVNTSPARKPSFDSVRSEINRVRAMLKRAAQPAAPAVA